LPGGVPRQQTGGSRRQRVAGVVLRLTGGTGVRFRASPRGLGRLESGLGLRQRAFEVAENTNRALAPFERAADGRLPWGKRVAGQGGGGGGKLGAVLLRETGVVGGGIGGAQPRLEFPAHAGRL